MIRAHAVADVRTAESRVMAGLPDGTLMQRAATALTVVCVDLMAGAYGRRVVLLVGGGDNGGDALLAGASLARRGARVDAVLVSGRAHGAGLAALRTAGGRVAPDGDAPALLAAADLLVDGVTGIGGRGPLRDDVAALLPHVGPDCVVVAVDVPSGVEVDSGEVAGPTVDAHATVTFGTAKPGLLVDPGASRAGQVVVADIGVRLDDLAPAVESLEADDVRARLRTPVSTDDKYSRGVVGVVAGSGRYTGAAVLAVSGAQAGGAGLVRAVLQPEVAEHVRAAHPEALVTDLPPGGAHVVHEVGRVQSWVVGPGSGTDDQAAAVLREVLAADVPVVLDADAVTLLAGSPGLLDGRRAATVLTPHAGELARLLGTDRADVEARRLEHVRVAAERFGATVLLKGSTTLVAPPDGGTVRANPRATAWLATAGAGDVLAGLVGALLAGGLDPLDAASTGAWLHAAAAAAGSDDGPVVAGDVADALPGVVAGLLRADDARGSAS